MDQETLKDVRRLAVSVVIPHYNQNQLVERCIASVACQLDEQDEIIIVDDHSSAPLTIDVDAWAPAVRIITLPKNHGPGAARNIGAEQANNQYVAFLDADDVAVGERIALQLAAFEGNSDWVGCVGGYAYQRDGQRGVRSCHQTGAAFEIREKLIEGHIFAAGSTLMVKRDLFLKIGGYNPALRVYEDWDLLLRMVFCSKVGHSGAPLAVISPSTRRAHKNERLWVLAQLHDDYAKSMNSYEYRSFRQALAYERASAYFREKNIWDGSRELLEGFWHAPLTLVRRLASRLVWGVP